MSGTLFVPPDFLVPLLEKLVPAGLEGAALELQLAEAYTSFLQTLSRGTYVSGSGHLTPLELAAAIKDGGTKGSKFASLTTQVKDWLRIATKVGDLPGIWNREAMRTLFSRSLQASAKELAKTATVEALEVAAAHTAAKTATQEGVKRGAWRAGLRVGARRVLVGALRFAGVVGTILTVWWVGSTVWRLVRPSATKPCPTPVYSYRKCPWTPEGYTVEACGPGFCYDGGPQGSLACKQENAVPNAHRSELNDLVCDDGYVPEKDPCANVILRCVQR